SLFGRFVVIMRFFRTMRILSDDGSGRNRNAESSQRFLSLLLPFSAAEALGGNAVPFCRFAGAFGFLLNGAKFPGDHAISRALKKFVKSSESIRTVFCLADACLYLTPIGHGQGL